MLSEEDAGRKLEQLLHACFDSPFGVGPQELRISAKAGLALFLHSKPLPAEKLIELLRRIPASPKPQEQRAAKARPAKVLVLDDDESMRALVRLHLSNAGYDVQLAEDAIVAGHLVLRDPPDLIIADVEMPYMDGFQFVEALKSDPAVAAISVIFLTVIAGGESRSGQIGAVGYLNRPVVVDRLLAMVAKHVPGGHPPVR